VPGSLAVVVYVEEGTLPVSQVATLPSKQEIGKPVGDFRLAAIGGETASLQTVLQGKKGAVVVFWSGVCSHCVRYDGYLNGFAQQHPELGLAAIASRDGETPDQIAATVAERNLEFPILHDPGGVVASQWFTQQTPRVFLLDSSGALLYRGAIDNFKFPDDPEYIGYLEPAIAQFLAGLPLTRTETASFGCAVRSVYYILPKAL
jgi:peroxiredoxin